MRSLSRMTKSAANWRAFPGAALSTHTTMCETRSRRAGISNSGLRDELIGVGRLALEVLERIRPRLEVQNPELLEAPPLAVAQEPHLLHRRHDLREQHLPEHLLRHA